VRPARRSATLSAAVAVLAGGVAGWLAGHPVPAVLALAGGVVTGVAVAALGDDDPRRVAAGVVLAATGAVVVLGGVVSATAVTLPLVAVGLGAATGALGALGRGRLLDAVGPLAVGSVPLGLAAGASVALPLVVDAARGVLSAALSAGGRLDLFGASVLALVAAVALREAVRSVPAVELAAREDRDRIASQVAAVDRALGRAIRATAGGVGVGLCLFVYRALVGLPPGVADLLGALFGTPLVRGPLVAVAVAGGGVAVTAGLVRWVGAATVEGGRRVASVLAGAALAGGLVVASVPLVAVAGALPPAAGDVVVGLDRSFGPAAAALVPPTVALLVVWTGLFALPAGVGLGLVPDRATGPAVASAGLFGVAVGVAGRAPAAAVVGVVAAGMVAWDLGEYAVGLGEEVAPPPATGESTTVEAVPGADHAEAVHAAGAVGVGVGAVLLGTGALVFARSVEPGGSTALAALAVALVGTLALVATLRG
jgi:hypothetical protein